MGVDSNRVIVATFAIGAALAAVAGVMWGANYASIQFAMGTAARNEGILARQCWAASATSMAP